MKAFKDFTEETMPPVAPLPKKSQVSDMWKKLDVKEYPHTNATKEDSSSPTGTPIKRKEQRPVKRPKDEPAEPLRPRL